MKGAQNSEAEIASFLRGWDSAENRPAKKWLQLFLSTVMAMDNIEIQFVSRPGVSYSIRPGNRNRKDRDFFAIIDVIDDDPAERWLSVCFYGDMISDPAERGEIIPGGLAGSDGYCFDMVEDDEGLAYYIADRLVEAGAAAAV